MKDSRERIVATLSAGDLLDADGILALIKWVADDFDADVSLIIQPENGGQIIAETEVFDWSKVNRKNDDDAL